MIRKAVLQDAHGIARAHVDSWRESYSGLVPDAVLQRLDYLERERRWQDILNRPEQLNYVAEDEFGKVLGFAGGGPERGEHDAYDGEIYAIYLLQAAQRGGIGRKLMGAVAATLHERGFQSALVWVLKDNTPARRFYEALGGQYVTEKTFDMAGTPIAEVAYGWPDITTLISADSVLRIKNDDPPSS